VAPSSHLDCAHTSRCHAGSACHSGGVAVRSATCVACDILLGLEVALSHLVRQGGGGGIECLHSLTDSNVCPAARVEVAQLRLRICEPSLPLLLVSFRHSMTVILALLSNLFGGDERKNLNQNSKSLN